MEPLGMFCTFIKRNLLSHKIDSDLITLLFGSRCDGILQF